MFINPEEYGATPPTPSFETDAITSLNQKDNIVYVTIPGKDITVLFNYEDTRVGAEKATVFHQKVYELRKALDQ